MKEIRALPFEVREKAGEEIQKVVGSGAVYNKRSQDLGGYVEIIRPGCFKRSLESGREIKSCYNHDDSKTLGSTEGDPPLVIRDTDKGVEYEVEIPDTTYGRDLKENLRRKLVRGSSFAFRTIEDNWYKDDKGQVVRELVDAELIELGPVNNPAYLPTEASLRALNDVYESKVSQMQAQEGNLQIEREAQARRVREVELLRLQIGGKE